STTAIISSVPGGLTFNFNPTAQANFELSVRPQFYGKYWSTWGPVKRVTATSPGSTTTTLAATAVVNNAATLNGTVNPNSLATVGYFQWGTTTNYGQTTAPSSLGSGAAAVPLAAPLTWLTGGQTYHFRAVGSNSAGVTFG